MFLCGIPLRFLIGYDAPIRVQVLVRYGRGMGIQHFLKNLEYDTLEIRKILLFFFSPFSRVLLLLTISLTYPAYIQAISKFKNIIFFAWYSPSMVVPLSILGTCRILVRWQKCRISSSELIDELMCLMPSILNLVWIVTFEIAFYL